MKKSENVAKRVIRLCCMITFFHYCEVKRGEMTKRFWVVFVSSYLKLVGKKPETKSECLSA